MSRISPAPKEHLRRGGPRSLRQAKKDAKKKREEWKTDHRTYMADMRTALRETMLTNLERQEAVMETQGTPHHGPVSGCGQLSLHHPRASGAIR